MLRDLEGSALGEDYLIGIEQEIRNRRLEEELEEERERSSSLRQENKDLKDEKKMLEDLVLSQGDALSRAWEEKKLMQEQRVCLQANLEETRVLLLRSEEKYRNAKGKEKKINGIVTTLCNDLLGAHNGMEVARMKTRHAEERCRVAEERLERERKDGICITNRIEELQQIQQKIISMIDGTNKKREGSSVGEERGTILSSLRNAFSKLSRKTRLRKGMENYENEIGWETPPRTTSCDYDGEALGQKTHHQSKDLHRGMRRRLLRIGNKRKCRREQTRLMMEEAEEVHQLVREDVTMLSGLLQRQSSVIKKKEDALEEMRKKVCLLEEKSQKEREGKRRKKWKKDSGLSIIKSVGNELMMGSGDDVCRRSRMGSSGTVGEMGTIR